MFDNSIFQMLYGLAESWTAIILMVCMFAVMMFRPQSIHSKMGIRLAIFFLGMSIIIPAAVTLFVNLTSDTAPGAPAAFNPRIPAAGANRPLSYYFSQFTLFTRYLFIGLSLILALLSIMPKNRKEANTADY